MKEKNYLHDGQVTSAFLLVRANETIIALNVAHVYRDSCYNKPRMERVPPARPD